MRALLERRAAIKAELEGINNQHPEALPDDAQARWDTLSTEAGQLEQRIGRQAQLDDLDRRVAGQPPAPGAAPRREVRAFAGAASEVPEGFKGTILRGQNGEAVPVLGYEDRVADFLPRSESRAAELGLGGYLRALYNGPQTELERRVMAEATQGAGGALVPAPLAAEVIDLLRARSVAFQAGVRTIPMSSQSVKFARITADPVGSWRAENAAITEGDPAFDSVTLTAKSWALLTRISRELLEDGQNVDQVLRAVFARAAAVALDQAILYGTGAANQPRGIANTTGIQTVAAGGANGAAVTGWAKLLDATAALEAVNAGDISAIVMAPRTSRVTYAFADSTNQPLEVPPRLRNIPILSSTSMPINETAGTSTNASSILMGDFGEVFAGIRTGLTISILNERYADTGQVGFVTWLRADVAIARPAAMARITGIIP
ncbi:phage major capsid protein [Belnapia arida]|nr:phage major capsid protein [Belnapia arida]